MTPAHLRVRTEAELALRPGQQFAIATDCRLAGERPEIQSKRPHLRPPVLIGLATQNVSLVLEMPAVEYDARKLHAWFMTGRKEP